VKNKPENQRGNAWFHFIMIFASCVNCIKNVTFYLEYDPFSAKTLLKFNILVKNLEIITLLIISVKVDLIINPKIDFSGI